MLDFPHEICLQPLLLTGSTLSNDLLMQVHIAFWPKTLDALYHLIVDDHLGLYFGPGRVSQFKFDVTRINASQTLHILQIRFSHL